MNLPQGVEEGKPHLDTEEGRKLPAYKSLTHPGKDTRVANKQTPPVSLIEDREDQQATICI